MHHSSAQTFTLAAILDAAGLGGTRPIDAARALLATLARQVGADDPDHDARHNAAVLVEVRRRPVVEVRAMLAAAPPDATMLILARLVASGAPESEILDYLPVDGRHVRSTAEAVVAVMEPAS